MLLVDLIPTRNERQGTCRQCGISGQEFRWKHPLNDASLSSAGDKTHHCFVVWCKSKYWPTPPTEHLRSSSYKNKKPGDTDAALLPLRKYTEVPISSDLHWLQSWEVVLLSWWSDAHCLFCHKFLMQAKYRNEKMSQVMHMGCFSLQAHPESFETLCIYMSTFGAPVTVLSFQCCCVTLGRVKLNSGLKFLGCMHTSCGSVLSVPTAVKSMLPLQGLPCLLPIDFNAGTCTQT